MKFMKSTILIAILATFMLAPGEAPEKATEKSQTEYQSSEVFTIKSLLNSGSVSDVIDAE